MEKKITKKNVFYDEKELLINQLNKLFSNPPSNYGYKHDIEVILNDLYIDENSYFDIIIESLTKEIRKKNELNLITSYLFFMKEFVKLLKDKESTKKETQILNELKNLASSIYYLKMPKNVVLMRYGEKGNKAYINLNGEVDVLIKSTRSVITTEKNYLYYLACLIKYNEFALINLVINENFFNFPLLIYDDIESKIQIETVLNNINKSNGKKFITFIKGENNEIKKIRFNTNNLINKPQIKSKMKRQQSSTAPNSFIEYFTSKNEEVSLNKRHQSQNLKNAFKLNLKNEELKVKIEPYIISSKQLLDLFNIQYLDKNNEELNNCSTEEYIKRISIIEKEIIKKNDDEEEEEKSNDSDVSNESLIEIKVYSYVKIVSLGKGNLFGELALRNPHAVRTATIITSSVCHFSYINRTTFNNCLKISTELHIKQQLSFFINLPIFIDIPITSFYKKYYTNISKHYIEKNHFILKQGQKPTRLCLLNKGFYILLTIANLSELSDLIFFLLKKIKKYKDNIPQIEFKNYMEIANSLAKNIEDEEKILRDNLSFKNFYYTESLIKITELDSPDIIGYDELIGEDDLYAFSIEAKTIENIIFTIDYGFYTDLFNKNSTVKKHHEDLIALKLDLIIKRLLKIRNNIISSFFNHKIETDISAIISKEMENDQFSNSKLKRFLQFKSTKCNFYSKNNISSMIKDLSNEKDSYFNDKNYCFRDKKSKSKEKLNIFIAYNSYYLKNNSKIRKNYKNFILPKNEIIKKKKKKYLFDIDIDNINKEEKLNKTSYKPIMTEPTKSKDKNIINIEENNKSNCNINKIINLLPIFNLRQRLKVEYSKINYNQYNYLTDNSKEVKGKIINNSIRCYFEKKIKPSKSIYLKILDKKREKNKTKNNKLDNLINKEKESIELVSYDLDNNKNNEFNNKLNNSFNRNEKIDKYYYFLKAKKRFSTPKNLKLNLLLLNNNSINFTNKNPNFQKSLQFLLKQNQNEESIKNVKNKKIETEINHAKSQNKEDNVIKIKNNNKVNYLFNRNSYYKKNLTRMKFFYGLDKK